MCCILYPPDLAANIFNNNSSIRYTLSVAYGIRVSNHRARTDKALLCKSVLAVAICCIVADNLPVVFLSECSY